MRTLVMSVRFHDGRYHGEGDWPPAPARLFQALVAGAGLGGRLGTEAEEALAWLEGSEAPVVAAPPAQRSRGVLFYMPNNDSDRVGGDPLRIAEIRTARKIFTPHLFDAEIEFHYAWRLDGTERDEGYSRAVCALAENLYQLGRGIDMAWAWGEIVEESEFEAGLSRYLGRVYRPSGGQGAFTLTCPQPGSLKSLKKRYRGYGERFRTVGNGKAGKVVFSQPPRPQFRSVPYESPPSRGLYELREPTRQESFAPWPLARAPALVVRLRDGAVERLSSAMPARRADIERLLVGRKPDGTNQGPTLDRVRIVPLPSIGYVHADREVRRVLIEVGTSSDLTAADVNWAFSGLEIHAAETGEVLSVLTPSASDAEFLLHYGVGRSHPWRVWRTATPAVLPEKASRRRIDPARRVPEAKQGGERALEQGRAADAVIQALRHAGVRARVEAIRVQREPFESAGARVEAFAVGTRFAKERLWHVEIVFGVPVSGPLVIGDGRFLGLGLMAPLIRSQGIHVFAVESGRAPTPNPHDVTRAFRRAVLARTQEVLGGSSLPGFFSGHDSNGAPMRSRRSAHLAFAFHPTSSRLLVLAPHVLDGREPSGEEKRYIADLEEALEDLREVRAGAAGRLKLHSDWIDVDTDALTAPSRTWESVTPYVVTRHAKRLEATEALSVDMRNECRRRGLPEPVVIPVEARGVPGVGLVGSARLEFKVTVSGPLLIGKTRYMGGGLFSGTEGGSH